MNDPHVERLIYDVIEAGTVSYENAAPGRWCVLDGRFRVSIDGATLTVEPTVHFASADEARAEIDPFIRKRRRAAGGDQRGGAAREALDAFQATPEFRQDARHGIGFAPESAPVSQFQISSR